MTNYEAFLCVHGLHHRPLDAELDRLFRTWLENRVEQWRREHGHSPTNDEYEEFDAWISRMGEEAKK